MSMFNTCSPADADTYLQSKWGENLFFAETTKSFQLIVKDAVLELDDKGIAGKVGARILALPIAFSTVALSLPLRIMTIAEPIFAVGTDLIYGTLFHSKPIIKRMLWKPVYCVRNLGIATIGICADIVLVGVAASVAGIVSPKHGYMMLGRY